MLVIPAKSFDLVTNITRVRCAIRMLEEMNREALLPHEVALYSRVIDQLEGMQEDLQSRWQPDLAR